MTTAHTPAPRTTAEAGSVSAVRPHVRVMGPDRDTITAAITEQYTGGASIRDIAAAYGRSYGWVHRIVTESEATVRTRGGNTRTGRSR